MAVRIKREKRKRTGLYITAMIVFLLCAVVSFQKGKLEQTRAEYQRELNQLTEEKARLEEEGEEIEEYRAYVQTKKYVEEIARSRLGLVYEDEIIFEGN